MMSRNPYRAPTPRLTTENLSIQQATFGYPSSPERLTPTSYQQSEYGFVPVSPPPPYQPRSPSTSDVESIAHPRPQHHGRGKMLEWLDRYNVPLDGQPAPKSFSERGISPFTIVHRVEPDLSSSSHHGDVYRQQRSPPRSASTEPQLDEIIPQVFPDSATTLHAQRSSPPSHSASSTGAGAAYLALCYSDDDTEALLPSAEKTSLHEQQPEHSNRAALPPAPPPPGPNQTTENPRPRVHDPRQTSEDSIPRPLSPQRPTSHTKQPQLHYGTMANLRPRSPFAYPPLSIGGGILFHSGSPPARPRNTMANLRPRSAYVHDPRRMREDSRTPPPLSPSPSPSQTTTNGRATTPPGRFSSWDREMGFLTPPPYPPPAPGPVVVRAPAFKDPEPSVREMVGFARGTQGMEMMTGILGRVEDAGLGDEGVDEGLKRELRGWEEWYAEMRVEMEME